MHTIRFAVFEGDSKTTFKDRREFSGSLLKQLEEAFAYIDMFNRTSSEFVGLDRIDKRAYPVEAIREALLNAIVHCDYGYSASTLISIFDNRIEFVTVGGLVKGFTKNDIMLGISVLSVCFNLSNKSEIPDKQYHFKKKYGIISARKNNKTGQKACTWREDGYV